MASPSVVTVRSSEPGYVRVLLPIWFFAAFLTKMKFVPALKNNLGPFEVIGVIALALFLVVESRHIPLRGHAVIRLMLIMVVLAATSIAWLPDTHTLQGLVQVSLLCFLLIFLVLIYNLALRYRISPDYLLMLITGSLLVIGPWALIHGFTEDTITASGPFRNRAHMGSYMLTAFWLVVVYALWPGLKKWKRLACYSALLITLYAIAASGRRSVYLALLVGVVSLGVAFLGAARGKRAHMAMTGAFVIAFLALLYAYADTLTTQTEFFKKRIGDLDDRVRAVWTAGDKYRDRQSFVALQRQGVLMAFRDSPVLGIGWGGFSKSRFSPTGHEVHSMPMRFLAELGLVGLGLYLALMGTLLTRSVRLFFAMRRTPYGGSYLALMLGLWSMMISYAYNRHLSERTFWLLIAVFLSLEIFALDYPKVKQAVARVTQPKPAPRSLAQPAAARGTLREAPQDEGRPTPRPRLLPDVRPEPSS